jgi:hypothetical protein
MYFRSRSAQCRAVLFVTLCVSTPSVHHSRNWCHRYVCGGGACKVRACELAGIAVVMRALRVSLTRPCFMHPTAHELSLYQWWHGSADVAGE